MAAAASHAVPQRTSRPPQVAGSPIIGSTRAFTRDPIAFVMHAAAQGDVVEFRLGNRTFYLVNHPDGVKRVLQDNNQNYDKGGFQIEILRRFIGEGLLLSDGDAWLRQRRLMQPLFHQRYLAQFADTIVAMTRERVRGWTNGATVDVREEMPRLTLDVVTQILFSTQVPGDRQDLGRALEVLLGEVSYRFENPLYPPLWVPFTRNRRVHTNFAVLEPVINRIIAERRTLLAAQPEADWPPDLLTLLMTARDEDTGAGMNDKELRDEVLTLFVAGHETTATALMWCWYLLGLNPDAEQRLHAEVDSGLRGSPATAGDLPSLPYTRMLFEESLRLYPPLWLTNRRAVDDDKLLGYHVPAGTLLLLSPYAMHRRADLWPEPDCFDPDRFSPASSVERPKFAFFPFGGGPHLCIGRGLAYMEAQLILTTVAQHCRLLPPPGLEVKPQALATLRPAAALPMRVQYRR
jgi:cytochrome P450